MICHLHLGGPPASCEGFLELVSFSLRLWLNTGMMTLTVSTCYQLIRNSLIDRVLFSLLVLVTRDEWYVLSLHLVILIMYDWTLLILSFFLSAIDWNGPCKGKLSAWWGCSEWTAQHFQPLIINHSARMEVGRFKMWSVDYFKVFTTNHQYKLKVSGQSLCLCLTRRHKPLIFLNI